MTVGDRRVASLLQGALDMAAMRSDESKSRWWVRGCFLAVTILIVASAMCLAHLDDQGSTGHVSTLDHCAGMLAISAPVMAIFGRLPLGWVIAPRRVLAGAVTLVVQDPPPRSTFIL